MILDLFRKEIGFENIQGYDDIKDIVRLVLDAEDMVEHYVKRLIGSQIFLIGNPQLFQPGNFDYHVRVEPHERCKGYACFRYDLSLLIQPVCITWLVSLRV